MISSKADEPTNGPSSHNNQIRRPSRFRFSTRFQARIAATKELGLSIYNEDALWDVVRKASRRPRSFERSPGSIGVTQKTTQARARLKRLTLHDAYREPPEISRRYPSSFVSRAR
ncbi:hypothetical protein C8J56DRAFT_1073222 [Mycena floridula]|nr:hypothetical protein C8J56DRAFT_1073222 [Mycena floridula]